jgi:methane/ammonia monooxygenase subunit C
MAVTTQAVSKPIAAGKTVGFTRLHKKNLIIWTIVFMVFNLAVRYYEEVYGWSAGLDAFAPEFRTYWMNWLWTELVMEAILFAYIGAFIWKTRDRNLDAVTPGEELTRYFHLLVWLVVYGYAIYWGASFYTEQDGTWHQTVIRDTDFTPSHCIEFYMSYPIYILVGWGSWMYSRTRLPYFAKGYSLPFLVAVVGPFMILPNVGLNEWGHTFWFMEELFVAPLHYGFVFFGWMALGAMGLFVQIFTRMSELLKVQLAITKT